MNILISLRYKLSINWDWEEAFTTVKSVIGGTLEREIMRERYRKGSTSDSRTQIFLFPDVVGSIMHLNECTSEFEGFSPVKRVQKLFLRMGSGAGEGEHTTAA
jgi:hypothetical protein